MQRLVIWRTILCSLKLYCNTVAISQMLRRAQSVPAKRCGQAEGAWPTLHPLPRPNFCGRWAPLCPLKNGHNVYRACPLCYEK